MWCAHWFGHLFVWQRNKVDSAASIWAWLRSLNIPLILLAKSSCPAERLCQHDQPPAPDPVQEHNQSDSALSFQRPAATESSPPGLQQIDCDQGKTDECVWLDDVRGTKSVET